MEMEPLKRDEVRHSVIVSSTVEQGSSFSTSEREITVNYEEKSSSSESRHPNGFQDESSASKKKNLNIYDEDVESESISKDHSGYTDTNYALHNKSHSIYEAKSSFSDDNDHRHSPDRLLDNKSPIIYHCLTFDTDFPLPSAHNTSSSIVPPPPDLTPYISPFLWSATRKRLIVILSSLATSLAAYTAGSYTSPVTAMASEWHVSEVAILAGVTTFCIGFAIAPMILAPFSEINGRYPVFVVAGVLYEVCQISCALTRSYPGMLIARFGVGVGSSVFSTMVGGVVSDLYHKEERNTPMALFSGAALFGTGLGPLVSGFLAQNLQWRWVFWLQVITCGIMVAAVAIFFQETRGSILLSRKAARLNKWYEEREKVGLVGFDMPVEGEKKESQRIRWRVKSDEERESLMKMVQISVYRPFHLLITEPVVFFFSLWVSFAWAVLYLTFGSIPLVFHTSHSFNVQQSGSVFASMSIAAILATLLSIYQESALNQFLACYPEPPHSKTANRLIIFLKTPSPEGRLYFACIESVLLPIGFFWFGWSHFRSIPWIVPTLAVGCATMGIYSVYLATFNYLTDAYHRYASSALAAQSFCRNIMGGVLPLVTTAMFKRLTVQGASSLLGGIGLLLTAVPWVLVLYGPKIRARSKFASEIM